MTNKKPEPLYHARTQRICPVCKKASYSAAGIHPQCASRQADEKQSQILKKKREKAAKTADKPRNVARWQKQCPKCKLAQHVRQKVCSCGHKFAVKARPSADSE